VTNTDLFGASDITPEPSAAVSASGEVPAATDKPKRRRAPGLNGMVLAELQQLASGLGIKSTGRMRKGELIEAIKAAQGGTSAPSGNDVPTKSSSKNSTEPEQQQLDTAPATAVAAEAAATSESATAKVSASAPSDAGASADAPASAPASSDTEDGPRNQRGGRQGGGQNRQSRGRGRG
jgi:transcription termination factor Rho